MSRNNNEESEQYSERELESLSINKLYNILISPSNELMRPNSHMNKKIKGRCEQSKIATRAKKERKTTCY